MSQRTDRIDELLRQEIGAVMARDVADPRIGFATITKVETARDLSHAKVWVSVIGQPAERSSTIAALRRAMPFIRHELGARLSLRRIPEFHVELDDTAERGTRVLHLLSELAAGSPVDPEEIGDGESLPTPVPRLPHEGDLDQEPPGAAIPPSDVRSRRRARPSTGPGRGFRRPGPVRRPKR